jgi:hypothetical protein
MYMDAGIRIYIIISHTYLKSVRKKNSCNQILHFFPPRGKNGIERAVFFDPAVGKDKSVSDVRRTVGYFQLCTRRKLLFKLFCKIGGQSLSVLFPERNRTAAGVGRLPQPYEGSL